MIEPQNTMLPFATESSPTGLPQGDVGFGEMLAQTLGMAPELNAGAFAPILPDQGHDDQAGGLAQDADTEPKQSASEDTVRFQRTPPAQVPVTRQFSLPRPVDGDSVVTDPIYGDDEGAERTPVQPGSEHPLPVVGEPELSPAIGLEQPPVVGAGRPPTLGSSVTSPVVDPVVDQPPMHRLDAGASRPSPVAEELVPVEPDPVRRSPIGKIAT